MDFRPSGEKAGALFFIEFLDANNQNLMFTVARVKNKVGSSVNVRIQNFVGAKR